MKKKILVALVLMMPLLSLAQERFYNLYEGLIIKQMFIINGHYITFGIENLPETSILMPSFNIIEASGELTESFYYLDTTDGYTFNGNRPCILIEDTLFIAGAAVDYYKAYTLEPRIMKYNLGMRTMDTIISYNHCVQTTNPQKATLDLIDTTSLGFVITGSYVYNSQNSFPLVIFTNRTGDTLGVKQYPFLPANPYRRRVFPYQTIAVPAGGYLMSCQDEIGDYNNYPDKCRAWFVRLDSAGNELWRRTTATQDTICFHPFAFVMPDGDYLITWSDPSLDNSANINHSLWLARMDNNGNISQKRKIQDYIDDLPYKRIYVNDYYQDSAGNIYLTGEAAYYTQPGFILKINPQGEVEWYRDYVCFPENTVNTPWTKFYSITPTPDGGFIIGGEYYSPPSSMFPSGVQKGLAVKVDACGCLEEDCNPDCYNGYSTQTIEAMLAGVYPNPASDVVTVSLPVKGSTARIELFDATGCQWVDVETECMETETGSQVKLNLNGLPAGVYVMNVWIGGKLCVGKVARE